VSAEAKIYEGHVQKKNENCTDTFQPGMHSMNNLIMTKVQHWQNTETHIRIGYS
jgi:hypothetical protein